MNKILEYRKVNKPIIVPIDLEFDDDDDKPIRVTDNYIDISYSSKETPARILSNLYPYKFDYYGNQVNSLEATIQSLKYSDENIRQACYEYSGIDAVHLKGMTPYDWQKAGILYTPLKPVDRFSEEYQTFLDVLYLSVFQNLLYRNNLGNSEGKMLDHTIGEDNNRLSTLTRTEYISRLYALRYCIKNQLFDIEEVMQVLKQVRTELI